MFCMLMVATFYCLRFRKLYIKILTIQSKSEHAIFIFIILILPDYYIYVRKSQHLLILNIYQTKSIKFNILNLLIICKKVKPFVFSLKDIILLGTQFLTM